MSPDNTNIKSDPANISHDDEIDLIQLAKTLWEGRRTVIKTTLIFMALGLFIAIFSPKEYTASTTVVPQTAEGGVKIGGNLGGLAAMAGINLGNIGGGSTIPPSLYPKIVNSIPFQKELMKTLISVDGVEGKVTLLEFYDNIYKPGVLHEIRKYTIGLPGLILKLIKGKEKETLSKSNEEQELIEISSIEKQLIEILSKKITIEINDKDNYVFLSTRMPEAKAAAQVTKNAQDLLQKKIIEFKIQKAKDQLKFIENRYDEKSKELSDIQQYLARFRDGNKNVITAVANTEFDRLKAEYDLVYGVCSELAKQLETQKIQVKENTPVFLIIQPVTVPLDKSRPKRLMILVAWTFMGGLIGFFILYGKGLIKSIREQW